MTHEDSAREDPLGDAVRRRLRTLVDGPEPLAELEESTVACLQAAGYLRGRRATTWRTALTAAIVIMLPVAGFFAGRWSSPPPTAPEPRVVGRYAGEWFSAPSAPEPRFALLLYGGPRAPVPEEAHANADRYSAWARQSHSEGRVLGGEPLMPDARVVGLAAGATLADAGPLRGFFLVDAVDLDAATELARGNPHLAAGGVIEVRPVGLSVE